MPQSNLSLQPAIPQDSRFVFEVMELTMRPYVEATWGPWDAEFQWKGHLATFAAETHRIILVDGSPAGVLLVADADLHLQLEKLFLLPQFHNQGLGSRVLQSVVVDAAAAAKPIRLRVLRVNVAAQRFYLRHGFSVTETTEERLFMQLACQ
jgi:GNAT superfamily N-acetyltransferase